MENVLLGRESVAAGVDKKSPWEICTANHSMVSSFPSAQQYSSSHQKTKGDSTSKMEPTSIAGIFAGYELSSGCRWSGIYMVSSLAEFIDIDLS